MLVLPLWVALGLQAPRCVTPRRLALWLPVLGPLAARAASESTTVKIDFAADVTGSMTSAATFRVPGSWEASDSRSVSSGGRRLVVYADPASADTNVFLLVTPVRGDYTSLGSFGTLDAVQDTIIPSGPDIDATIVKAFSSPGRYHYEYTIQVPDQPKRHLNTVFTLINDNIITFTTQAKEQDYTAVAANLKTIEDSFTLTKL